MSSCLTLQEWHMKRLMAEWLGRASYWHEMYCHDLEVMGLNPGQVKLGVHSTFKSYLTPKRNLTIPYAETLRDYVCNPSEVSGQRERSGVPTGGAALDSGNLSYKVTPGGKLCTKTVDEYLAMLWLLITVTMVSSHQKDPPLREIISSNNVFKCQIMSKVFKYFSDLSMVSIDLFHWFDNYLSRIILWFIK